MSRTDWLCGGIFAVGAVAFLALVFVPDWKPTPPWMKDYGRCLASHEEVSFMLFPDSNGGTTMLPTTDTVCDVHEYPAGDGPDYQRRYREFEVRLADWHKRNPKEPR